MRSHISRHAACASRWGSVGFARVAAARSRTSGVPVSAGCGDVESSGRGRVGGGVRSLVVHGSERVLVGGEDGGVDIDEGQFGDGIELDDVHALEACDA